MQCAMLACSITTYLTLPYLPWYTADVHEGGGREFPLHNGDMDGLAVSAATKGPSTAVNNHNLTCVLLYMPVDGHPPVPGLRGSLGAGYLT